MGGDLTLGEKMITEFITDINRAIKEFHEEPKPKVENRVILESDVGDIVERETGDGVRRSKLGADSKYYTTDLDTLKEIVYTDPRDHLIWFPDSHDCDDFARAMWSVFPNVFGINSVGYVHDGSADNPVTGNVHAYNCIIDSQERLWFFEPSDDGMGLWSYSEFPIDGNHVLTDGVIVI